MRVRTVLLSIAAVALCATLTGIAPATANGYASTPSYSLIPNGRVYAILSTPERVYIGGTFTKLKDPTTGISVARARLAAFDAATGALVTDWNPGADAAVRALAIGDGGVVYAGGTFLNAAGAPAAYLAAIQPDGTPLPGFSAIPNNQVRDIAVLGGSLYVAGTFTKFGDKGRVGVARLNATTGALNTTFNARVGGGRVIALAPTPDGAGLVIGGNFTTIAGIAQSFLGAVSLASGARLGWTPPVVCGSCNVIDVASDGVDGVFAGVAGGGGGRVARWSYTSSSRLWVKAGDGDVQAVTVDDGLVYVGGHFGTLDGTVHHQLAAVDAATGAVADYQVPFTGLDDPGVWAITATSAGLRIGGGFQGISGSPAKMYAVLPPVA